MEIEYKNINEALNFYNITDKEYKNKCYQCIENINKNNEILNKFNDIYKLLYEDKTDEYRKLWEIKNPKELFGQDYPIFGTNILLLLGYRCHIKNIEKITFDNEQITIQKQRVKECLENDIIYKNYDEIRISQMLWGTYFINNRLIEVGRLQFEPINDILNFVFNMRECDNYNNLSEKTSLQRKIKEFLINGGKIYNGYGEINEEIIS